MTNEEFILRTLTKIGLWPQYRCDTWWGVCVLHWKLSLQFYSDEELKFCPGGPIVGGGFHLVTTYQCSDQIWGWKGGPSQFCSEFINELDVIPLTEIQEMGKCSD
jgi:hypothetical protein